MNGRRSNIRLNYGKALSLSRIAICEEEFVYIFVCDRTVPYRKGRSHIIYIGKTGVGCGRIAHSAAVRAKQFFPRHPKVDAFHGHVVTCRAIPRVDLPDKLETALLGVFEEMFGELPVCNANHKESNDEFEYFRKRRVEAIIKELS